MSELKYEMKPVTKKHEKISGLHRSIYDPVLDQFLESGEKLVEITFEGKEPSSVMTQLKKRIEKRRMDDVEVSRSGVLIYLEKKT